MLRIFSPLASCPSLAIVISAVLATCFSVSGSAGPTPGDETVDLANPVEVVVGKNLYLKSATVLPDGRSVVVVGTSINEDDRKPILQELPPAGAIVDLIAKKARPFTNDHSASIESVVSTADGALIVTVGANVDPMIRIWDVKQEKPLEPIDLSMYVDDDEADYLQIGCFHRERRVAVCLDEGVAIFDLDRGEFQGGWQDPWVALSGPSEVAVSPDDTLVACLTGAERMVIWDPASDETVLSRSLIPRGDDDTELLFQTDWSIPAFVFTPDGKEVIVARSGADSEVPKGTDESKVPAEKRALFRIDIARKQVTPLGMGNQIDTNDIAIHPDGEWIVTAGSSWPDQADRKDAPYSVGEIRVYHYPSRTLALKRQFDEEEFRPFIVAFSPDGKKLVAIDPRGKVRAWDFSIGKR